MNAFNKNNKNFLILLVFLLLAGMAYVTYGSLFGLVPDQGIGREAVAAALGALFVVVATGIQLFQQTDMEIERHKKQKTYEHRLECYKELLASKENFKDDVISNEKVANVVSKKLQAVLVCEQIETFRCLDQFVKIIGGVNDKSSNNAGKLKPDEADFLTDAYDNLTDILMLDLKDGRKNLEPSQIKTIDDSLKWFEENTPEASESRAPITRASDQTGIRLKKNMEKVLFNGVPYRKNTHVYKVLESYIDTNRNFNKFNKMYSADALAKIFGDEKIHLQQFEGANPMWLTRKRAEDKKNASNEKQWKRYWIDDSALLTFESGEQIAVRNGQDTNSIDTFQKWCRANEIPCH